MFNYIISISKYNIAYLVGENDARRVKKLEWIEIARLADSSILSKLRSLKLPKHLQSSFHDSVNEVLPILRTKS